jgi:KDO2-lipid IV(A) lauroyltransferase
MKLITAKDLYLLSVVALIKAVSWLPSPGLRGFFVSGITSTAYRVSKKKRRLSEKNLSEAFEGELDRKQIPSIVRQSFYEFWSDIFSLSLSSAERADLKRLEFRGAEHLHRALKEGRGIILWESSHLGKRILAKQILNENGFSIHQVHIQTHLGGFHQGGEPVSWVGQNIIKPVFEECERRVVADIIYLPESDSLTFTRTLLNRLKRNAILCISGDGKVGQRLIPLKFLGRTDLFSTGMVSLAKISGAPILPMFCIRDRDGRTSLIIEQPIHMETGAQRERGLEIGVAQYVSLLESYIRRHPEQYRNWQFLGKFYERQNSSSKPD